MSIEKAGIHDTTEGRIVTINHLFYIVDSSFTSTKVWTGKVMDSGMNQGNAAILDWGRSPFLTVPTVAHSIKLF